MQVATCVPAVAAVSSLRPLLPLSHTRGALSGPRCVLLLELLQGVVHCNTAAALVADLSRNLFYAGAGKH